MGYSEKPIYKIQSLSRKPVRTIKCFNIISQYIATLYMYSTFWKKCQEVMSYYARQQHLKIIMQGISQSNEFSCKHFIWIKLTRLFSSRKVLIFADSVSSPDFKFYSRSTRESVKFGGKNRAWTALSSLASNRPPASSVLPRPMFPSLLFTDSQAHRL